jgi:peroxiredoxin Q/BCP
MSDFTKLDTIVLGVSKDSVASHRRFQKRFSLGFPLLSDADSDVCERYGVWKTRKLFGHESTGIERTTFVIDETGRIAGVFPKVKLKGHVKEVLAAIAEM